MTGLTKFVESMASGGSISNRDTALRDEFNGIVVDTCLTNDCGWETGIQRGSEEWVIVEEYPNQEEATQGHKKWVKTLKENPKIELKNCRSAEDWALGY